MNMRYSPLAACVAHGEGDPWALHWRAQQAKAAGRDVILLSVGDPDLDTPVPVVDAAVAALRGGDTHYTETIGRPRLRELLAQRHSWRTRQPVQASQVAVLNGAQNALFATSLVLAGPGDELIALDPMYSTYPATLKASGAALVRVAAPATLGFQPDIRALEAAITPRTRAIFYSTPNNPSGAVFTEEAIAAIAALARRHSLWVVSDEVYAGLAEGGRVPSIGRILPEQTVTVGSFSKTHAMTGWRSGWLVGPGDFIGHIEDLAGCMLYGLSGFVQAGAIRALEMADEAEAFSRDYCRGRCEFLHARLQDLPGVRVVRPEAGMFMLLDVRASGIDSATFAERLFDEEGVAMLDAGLFGRETRGFVRACHCASDAVLEDAAARIRRFCERLRA